MARFKFTIIILITLMICPISNAKHNTNPNANNMVKLFSDEGKAWFVLQSEIRKNLTNYRNGDWITMTQIVVFLTREESQDYMKKNPCLTFNNSDYKYVLETLRFKFEFSEGLYLGAEFYDKFDNLVCRKNTGGMELPYIIKKDSPFYNKIEKLFQEADRKEKLEPF